MKTLVSIVLLALAGCGGGSMLPAYHASAFDTPGGPVGRHAVGHRIADHPTQMLKR